MPSSRVNWPRLALGLVLCLAIALVQAEVVSDKKPLDLASGVMSLAEIDEKLQECPVVQTLAAQKLARQPAHPSQISRLFALLFPSANPAINALLATLYISGPPNFLLALCPPSIDPASLSVMVAFAVGGLLGDTLFHLLPEIFLGEDAEDPNHVRLVLLEPNRNLLLGVAILVGFMVFVAMDKGLRIATGGDAHSHSHSHSHAGGAHQEEEEEGEQSFTSGQSTAIENATNGTTTKSRKSQKAAGPAPSNNNQTQDTTTTTTSVKLGGLLNMIADFTHNITDGLALSASFYASPTVGATTTMAVFFHEIPHEVGDFALLIQSGFSKRAAMGAQFVTALGALLGTVIGIAVQEFGGAGGAAAAAGGDHQTILAPPPMDAGIWGTSLTYGDLLLPFTAGTFLYVGTVAVIPELLETGSNKREELGKMASQFAAIALGAGIMLWISWH